MRCFILFVASAHIALPVNLLRYVSHSAGSAQGAASRRRPLYPRAPASKIATAWYLRLIPAGFGSGRGSVRAKHGPQPASMRAAPAFRERLSDVEAASTGSFSGPMSGGDSHIGTGPRRPGKRSATRQNNGATGLPGRSSTLARQRCACAGLGGEPTGGPRRPGNALSRYPGSWTRPGFPTGRIRRRARLSPAPRHPA